MSNLQYQEYYRRHLPHFQPRGFGFFITFRLANSLPREVVEKLLDEAKQLDESFLKTQALPEEYNLKTIEQQKLFEQWDIALHTSMSRNRYLEDERVASIVVDSIRFHDKEWFDLEAFCIMPNHVHLVLTPMEKAEGTDYSLAEITHNIKRNSSKQANQILGRTGAFWQHENYDHVIRDSIELERIVQYVLYNPVKASLIENRQDWKWSYSKCEI